MGGGGGGGGEGLHCKAHNNSQSQDISNHLSGHFDHTFKTAIR